MIRGRHGSFSAARQRPPHAALTIVLLVSLLFVSGECAIRQLGRLMAEVLMLGEAILRGDGREGMSVSGGRVAVVTVPTAAPHALLARDAAIGLPHRMTSREGDCSRRLVASMRSQRPSHSVGVERPSRFRSVPACPRLWSPAMPSIADGFSILLVDEFAPSRGVRIVAVRTRSVRRMMMRCPHVIVKLLVVPLEVALGAKEPEEDSDEGQRGDSSDDTTSDCYETG